MTERCVVYTRVSSKEQVSNLSLETQRDRCAEFARGRGWVVAAVFVEQGESAKTADRDELRRLLDYCRAHRGHVHYVVVYALNRLARNTQDHLVLRGILGGMGIQLRSVTEPVEEGSAGRFVETLLAAVAQFDNDVRAERTIAGMRAAIARGRWPHLAPIGYRNARDGAGQPTLDPDPDWAPLISQAFLWAAAGETQRAIGAKLRAFGLRARRGGPIAAQTVARLLRNPAYAGRIRSRAFGVEAPAAFPPLVTEAVFQAAQAALARDGVSQIHDRQNPEFPLKHFVRCGDCGRPLTGYWAKGRPGRYAYYECPGCRLRAKRDQLEDAFVQLLDELRPTPKYWRAFKTVILDVWKRRHAEAARAAETLARRAGELRTRRERLIEAFVYERSVGRVTYDSMLSKVDGELAEVETARASAQVSELDAGGLVDYAIHVATHAGTLWRSAQPEQRGPLQAFLFPTGLQWTKAGFVRTALTGPLFNGLQGDKARGPESGVPQPRQFEPVIDFLRAAERLRAILPAAA